MRSLLPQRLYTVTAWTIVLVLLVSLVPAGSVGATESVTVTASVEGPDLVPSGLKSAVSDPAIAAAGQMVFVGWTTSNVGNSIATAPWNEVLYLSTDATFDASDISMGGREQRESLNAGSSYQQSMRRRLPDVTPGNYYLLLVTDDGNKVSEADETNNVAPALPITVTSPSDLIPTNMTAPSSAQPGETISATFTVQNQSATINAMPYWYDAIAFSSDTIWDSNDQVLVTKFQDQIIPAGANYQQTVYLTIPTTALGTNYLILWVDKLDNWITETDETNNILVLPINIQTSSTAGECGTIRGQVTNLDTGAPMPGIIVTLPGTSLSGTTDQDGIFTIGNNECVPQGTHDLEINVPGYVPYTTTVTVTTGATTELPTVTMEYDYGTLTSSVLDPVTGQPISGAQVKVGSSGPQVTTEINGVFTIAGLLPSVLSGQSYQIEVIHPDYDPKVIGGIVVKPGQEGLTQLEPIKPTPICGIIRGRVINLETGEPIAGATVTIPSTGQSAITDANGIFVIAPQGCVSGSPTEYLLEIAAPGLEGPAVTVSVQPGEDVFLADTSLSANQAPTVTLSYDPHTCIFTITAIDQPGGSGVQVIEYSLDGGVTWMVYTGGVSLESKADGTYPVQYRATDHAGNTSPVGTADLVVDNTPPVVDVSGIDGAGTNVNPDGGIFTGSAGISWTVTDPHLGTVDVQLNGGPCGCQPGSLVITNPGTYTLTITAVDTSGNKTIRTITFVVNTAPSADAGPDQTVDEGATVMLDGSGSSDLDGDALTYSWKLVASSGPSVTLSDLTSTNPTFVTTDNGTYTFELTVTDSRGASDTDEVMVSVNNVAPIVGIITGPIEPVKINTSITVSSSFTDVGTADTHTAVWDWGDGTTSMGSVSETGGSGLVTGSHSYTAAGVYTVSVTVIDDDGGADSQMHQYIVVYDPNGGFVTGGGWIESPAGAYAADPSLAGKAHFGFVAKYKKGAKVPDGNTQFQFQAGDLNFKSTSYDWLVVSGARAKFKGVGTINGVGSYGFMLTAGDGQIAGGGGNDTFRIKIWDSATGDVVYDNELGVADDADATTVIGGGSIAIHKSK